MKTIILLILVFLASPLFAGDLIIVKHDINRSKDGDNYARVWIKDSSGFDIAVWPSQICGVTDKGHTQCGRGMNKLKAQSGRSVNVDLGKSTFPLERVFLKN